MPRTRLQPQCPHCDRRRQQHQLLRTRLTDVLRATGLFLLGILGAAAATSAQQVSGEMRLWHTVTVDFAGPMVAEIDATNPFFDYRLDVTWTGPSGQTLVTPGYFAADGDAAETSADSGTIWRTHFVPDEVGDWSFVASFVTGPKVAIGTGGTPTAFDGQSGLITILDTDKLAPDFRSKGLLRYVGRTAPRFQGTDEPFLELGINSPENVLAFHEIDNTVDLGGEIPNFLHTFAPHVQDFDNLGGGPTWQEDKGKGLFGTLNYFRSQGLNSVFLLTFTGYGDCDDVWPWLLRDDPTRYDCSKLAQWQRYFDHATTQGVHVQITLTETENEAFFELTGTDDFFDDNRKLYHRELVARFGHSLAITWNIGEENGWSAGTDSIYRRATTGAQRRAFSEHLRDLDPYDHPIIVHSHHSARGNEGQDGVFGALCDPLDPALSIDGVSMQGPHDSLRSLEDPSNLPGENNHAKTREWVDCSRAAAHPWVVGHHEQRPSIWGAVTDGAGRDPNHDLTRKDVLWGTLMAGGTSVQHYFGYAFRNTTGDDNNVENYRTRVDLWRQTRVIRDFFDEHLPWDQMVCQDELVDNLFTYCFAQPTELYAVYFRDGGTANLDLSGLSTEFTVQWFDPRNGGPLVAGSVTTVLGGGMVALGTPPNTPDQDWVALVRNTHSIPDTSCGDPRRLDFQGTATIGQPFDIAFPEAAGEANVLMIGFPPAGPFPLPTNLLCSAPSGTCDLGVLPIASLSTANFSVQLNLPPSAAGAALRFQAVTLEVANTCLKVSDAAELRILELPL
ncbi:MAG: DUF5060 domain-containing protein [Planctomycetota bacterium]